MLSISLIEAGAQRCVKKMWLQVKNFDAVPMGASKLHDMPLVPPPPPRISYREGGLASPPRKLYSLILKLDNLYSLILMHDAVAVPHKLLPPNKKILYETLTHILGRDIIFNVCF